MKFVKKIVIGIGIFLILAIVLLLLDYAILNIHYSVHKNEYKEAFKVYGNTGYYVPQGLAFWEEDNIVLQTSYNGKHDVSMLYVIDFKSGKLLKSIQLRDMMHQNNNRHVGGVATDGKNIWITSDYHISVYSYKEAIDTSNKRIDSLLDTELPIRGDFCSYHDETLWIGDFYLKPFYDVPNGNPLLMSYTVTDEINFAKPNAVISLPKMVQGLTFNDKGEFVLTASFTYLIHSNFYVYQNVLNKKSKETINVGNKKIPYYQLNKNNLVTRKKLPPMAEGLFYYDGSYYILFESSTDYYPMALPRIKSVIQYKNR